MLFGLLSGEIAMFGRILRGRYFVAAIATLSIPSAVAQTSSTPNEDAGRQEAFRLYDEGKYVEALPLLESYVTGHPGDITAKEHWAFSIVGYATTLADPIERNKARAHARVLAYELKDAGDNSNLLHLMLAIPEDGSAPPYSNRKDVDDAMKAAEADFARGDLDKAREGYVEVLTLDPSNYEATLFTGDVYFKQKAYEEAGQWFGRAIQINPDRETAYRYWGDALTASSKNSDARKKFIEAVVAEPYSNKAWIGVRQWVDRNKTRLNIVVLKDKSSIRTEGQNTTVTLDPNALGSDAAGTAAWIVYDGVRLSWQREKFKKEFPQETAYRHSLKEETEALDSMVTIVANDTKGKKAKDIDPALLALVQIDKAGLLEPFVLFNRADNGIAHDYAEYRRDHRANLYRYLDEFVVPKTP